MLLLIKHSATIRVGMSTGLPLLKRENTKLQICTEKNMTKWQIYKYYCESESPIVHGWRLSWIWHDHIVLYLEIIEACFYLNIRCRLLKNAANATSQF